jgi:hypothetical protein
VEIRLLGWQRKIGLLRNVHQIHVVNVASGNLTWQ